VPSLFGESDDVGLPAPIVICDDHIMGTEIDERVGEIGRRVRQEIHAGAQLDEMGVKVRRQIAAEPAA
jgi:hypothetical protein